MEALIEPPRNTLGDFEKALATFANLAVQETTLNVETILNLDKVLLGHG